MDSESDVYVVKYNSDGNYIMSGHTDRTVKLWNSNKGSLIKTYSGVHNREIFDVAIFSDNNRFASCGGD
jgi:mitogen-activated protein kinase organizer 1